MKAFAL